jgi:hypothetical protein
VDEFENEFNCLLIDFGSCSIQGQKRMPFKSTPWNAPELEHCQELTTDSLILSDIYSFGLLCIHILLPLQDLMKANALFLRQPEQTDAEWSQFLSATFLRKQKDTGDSLALDILKTAEESSIPPTHKFLIREIVNSTIQTQPDHRKLPWAEILPYIEPFISDK